MKAGVAPGMKGIRPKDIVRIAGFSLSLLIFPGLVMSSLGSFLEPLVLRVLVLGLLAVAGAAILAAGNSRLGWREALLFSWLLNGAVYKVATFIPDVSGYPWSLGWSEGSRYYYASLFFSERIYGVQAPASVLHPSRYLMQAVPFWISESPLWLHRLWQVFLWLAFSGGAALVIARRLPLTGALWKWSFALWAFLFFYQGPVYYHLLVMVVLVVWGFDSRRATLAGRALNWGVILLASAWAGISRVNWLPVPGMLAATLYFLERQVGDKPPLKYLIPPVLWVLFGSATGLLTQQLYAVWSGNPVEHFGSSFTSDLLWYRLLPNPTYPLGVLLAAGLVSLPLALLIAQRFLADWRWVHPLRWLGLAGMLFMLFAGGVVVSVKIGGGSNLHNLDAYLVLLLMAASHLMLGEFQVEAHSRVSQVTVSSVWVAAAVILPVMFALGTGGPLPTHDTEQANAEVAHLQETIDRAASQGGEILFISQRHLLTFHKVEGVTLAPAYELVFLMEMAMASNPHYLGAFQADLQQQRFVLIISEPLYLQYQGRGRSFGEENDAWVRQVSEPVLCYYSPVVDIVAGKLQAFAPRQEPCR